jgi:diguanylate cyclase (GGDEF)-like protein
VLALNLPTENSGCPVGTPRDCPAITRGQTQHFTDSDALDACPQLVDRPDGACSATCVPLSIGGKSIGVLHVIDAPRRSIDAETGTRLELISRKAGDRIGMLRAFNRSETEARSDQLTGLLNRRSLEDEVRRVVESGEPYAVAYGDLDHFKQLNDVYGHDTGDRALRLFSRVLRDSVRPRDIPARYGGEEFVVVLPDCTLTNATQVLERVRENLARAQSDASVPQFTVSFGLSDSDSGARFEDVLKSADGKLSEAKAQGRDRVVAAVSSAQKPQPESDPSLTTIGRPVAVANESSPTQT